MQNLFVLKHEIFLLNFDLLLIFFIKFVLFLKWFGYVSLRSQDVVNRLHLYYILFVVEKILKIIF